MSTLKAEAGFTFLEVMIAFSIIALVLVGIYQLQTQNIALAAHSRFNTIAPMLARQKAAEIMSSTENPSMSGSGDFGEDFPGYRYETEISDFESDSLGETTKRLKKVDILITNVDLDGQFRLQTYFFFDQEP